MGKYIYDESKGEDTFQWYLRPFEIFVFENGISSLALFHQSQYLQPITFGNSG